MAKERANGWIDAHCHLSDPRLMIDLLAVVERSFAAGVSGWVLGGVDPDDWSRQETLKKHLGAAVTLAFGVHPWRAAEWQSDEVEAALGELENRLAGATAIGELGLDASPNQGGKKALPRQFPAFERQLALARRHRKPVVLHVVQAHDEALAVLEKEGELPAGGLVHSFGGSLEIATRYLALGLTLSLGAAVTRSGYRALKVAVPALPSDSFVVETDAPDQPPGDKGARKGGSGHEPSSLPLIAGAIAKLRGESAEDLLERSSARVRRIFGA